MRSGSKYRRFMRKRADIEADLEALVADCRSAAAEHDDVSYEIDHARLNELLEEYDRLPHQR